jgi:hypothetical protein
MSEGPISLGDPVSAHLRRVYPDTPHYTDRLQGREEQSSEGTLRHIVDLCSGDRRDLDKI